MHCANLGHIRAHNSDTHTSAPEKNAPGVSLFIFVLYLCVCAHVCIRVC